MYVIAILVICILLLLSLTTTRTHTQDFDSQVPWPRKESTIPDLRHATKNISLAAAKAVSAGRSLHPGEISVCAGMARNSVAQLLGDATALAWSAETEDDKSK